MFVQGGFAGMKPATRLADYPNQLLDSGLEDVRYQLLPHQCSSQVFTNLLVHFSPKNFFFSILYQQDLISQSAQCTPHWSGHLWPSVKH